jgi:RHS repeat-associated protein
VLPAAAREAMAPRYGPVNTYSGVLSFARTDLSVPDAGAVLVASRIYRSDLTGGSDAGPGWSVSYSEGLSAGGGLVSMALPDGRSLGFLTDPAAGYVPAPGVAAAFGVDPGATTITAADQTGYRFDPAGELTGLTLGDPGHVVTVSRSGGRPARVTGVSGRYLEYQRTGGLVSTVADSAGRRVGLAYAGGRLAAVSGVDGQAESYGYDGQGRLTTVTSPMGRARLAVGYDGTNRVAWLERQGVGRVTLDYRPAEGATVITQPDGGQIRQEYDFAGRLVAEQVTAGSGAAGGSGWHAVYDGEGHLVLDITGVPNLALSGHGPSAPATLYDGSGDPVLTVDPVGGFVAATFDARHRPLVVTQSVTATSTAQTVRTYTPEGRLSTVTDPVGKRWQFASNARGQITGRTDPAGRQISLTYAGNGDVSSRADETGAVTGFEHDPAGRLAATIDPLGHRVQVTYTAWDAISTHTRATGGLTTLVYDADRRPVSATDPVGGSTRYEYDPAGRTAAVTDPAGGRTSIGYDPMGRPATVTGPGSASTTRVYSAEGWPVRVTDPAGAVTTTSYDPAGRPIRLTDALGQVVQTVYTRAGKVATVQTPDGATRGYGYDAAGHASAYFGAGPGTDDTWTTTYDAAGRVAVVADPLGHQRRTSYDDAGRVAAATDPMGVTRSYAYSDAARTLTVTDPMGTVSVQTRDAAGRIVADTDAAGAVTSYGYDGDGQVVSVTDPDGVVTGYEYDPAGRLTALTDGAGRRTTYTLDHLGRLTGRDRPGPGSEAVGYDPAGNPTSHTDPTGQTWTASYDPMGRVLTQTDPLGHTTSYGRDPLGRIVSTTDPAGVITTTGYDPVGRVAVQADTSGASWLTRYDGEGRVTSTVDPVGVTWTYTLDRAGRLTDAVTDAGARHYLFGYDAADRLATESAPYSFSYGYNARGEQTSRTDALGHTTTVGYDGAGRPTTITVPSGHTTTTGYTPGGRVASASDPLGNTATYGYDSAGQLVRITLPRGGHYDYTYDDAGLLAAETDPLGHTTTFGYDPAGRPVSTSYPSGRVVESGYDSAGRLTTATAGGQTRSYGYDQAGRLVSATSPTGALGFGYDSRGLLIRSTDGRGETGFDYDAAHRLTRRTPAAGTPTVYGHDAESGDVVTVRGPMNLDIDRGPGGRINRIRGVSPSSTAVKETYTYNAAGQLTSTTAGATPASQVTYDIDGQVTSHAQNHGNDPANNTTDLTYDSAGRLTTAVLKHGSTVISTTSYGWDPDANRTTVATTGQPTLTTSYDLADRPTTSSDGTSYMHDLDGNLTATTKAGATATYTYDAFNELIGTSTAGVTVGYTRDPLGRVARRTQTGAADHTTYYDATTLVGGLRTGTGPTLDAIRLPDDGKLLALAGPSTTTLRIQSTVHGDLSGLWNATTGAALSATTYDPFGVPTTSGTDPTGLGWQTMPADPTNGLVDMTFRHYQPNAGRFTAPDNLPGDPDRPITLNRYLYANASPANYYDPDGHSGLASAKDGGIGGIGAGAGVAIAGSGITLTMPKVIPAIRDAVASIRIPCPLVCTGGTARTELAVKPIDPAAGGAAAATAAALAALGNITDIEIDSINCLRAALLPWTKECGGSGIRPGGEGGGDGGTGAGGTGGGGGSSPWTGLPRPSATIGSGHVVGVGAAVAGIAAAAVANATAQTATATAMGDGPGGCSNPLEIIAEIAQATVDGVQSMYDLVAATDHPYNVLAASTLVDDPSSNGAIGCGPKGESIREIPGGSSGGPGAGRRIPPDMLSDYNIGVNADPNLPTPLCSYCRTNPATSIDHVHPRSQGGDLTGANTTPACTFCNSSKGARGAPVNPPPNYTGPWPPPWWPANMR